MCSRDATFFVQVIQLSQKKNNNTAELELELYPVNLKILRHVSQANTRNTLQHQQVNWSNTVGGYGAAALGTTGYAYVTSLANTPKRYLAYVAAFSRMATLRQVYQYLCNKLRIKYEDVRLWSFRGEVRFIRRKQSYV